MGWKNFVCYVPAVGRTFVVTAGAQTDAARTAWIHAWNVLAEARAQRRAESE